MTILYLLVTAAGLAAIFWGIPASHRLPGAKGALAALAAVVGLVVALLGILLAVIPNFFRT